MNNCVICGKEIPEDRKVCSLSCRGKYTASFPRKRKIIYKEKIAKELKGEGYLYYTWSMLTDEERELFDETQRTILVHRYIMTMHLERALDANEVVMHINGDKKDNRIENLCLGTHEENTRQHFDAWIDASKSKRLAAWVMWALA